MLLLIFLFLYTYNYIQQHLKLPTTFQKYRVGQKNRTCLSIDNSAMVTRRNACDMSKVLECCKQKGAKLA